MSSGSGSQELLPVTIRLEAGLNSLGVTNMSGVDPEADHVQPAQVRYKPKRATRDRGSATAPDKGVTFVSISARLSKESKVAGRPREADGAGGGNRTHTLLPESDFESDASTSSATPARLSFALLAGGLRVMPSSSTARTTGREYKEGPRRWLLA